MKVRIQFVAGTVLKQSRYRPGGTQGGSRKLMFPDFVTTHDGGRLSALRTSRLYPRKYSSYSFLLEATRGVIYADGKFHVWQVSWPVSVSFLDNFVWREMNPIS